MMKKELIKEQDKREAERHKKEMEELEANPLLQYSTSQLKKELQRRKRQ